MCDASTEVCRVLSVCKRATRIRSVSGSYTRFLPRNDLYGVCSTVTVTLFTRPVDILSVYFVPVYVIRSTCAPERRSCRYRRDRATSVGCRRYCVRALLSPETSMLNGVRYWYYHPGRCYSIISLPPLTPSMTPTPMQTQGTELATAPSLPFRPLVHVAV